MKRLLVVAFAALVFITGAQAAQQPLTFVLAGQSNMAGHGPLDGLSTISVPHITAWSPTGWVPATDPIPYSTGTGTSPAMPFAKAVQHATGRNVRLVQCAVGATALALWEPRAALYDDCVARVRQAGVGTVSGVLFFQGESDTAQFNLANAWATGFGWFVSGVRVDFHRKLLPVVFAQIGHCVACDSPYWGTVQTQQASYHGRGVAMIHTSDLEQLGDSPHFTTPSYRVIGQRFATAWLSLLKRG